jgi:hypothetical protein
MPNGTSPVRQIRTGDTKKAQTTVKRTSTLPRVALE